MNLSSNAIPEHIKRLINPAERAKLGESGLLAAEIQEKVEEKAELDIQADIASYLRLHEIEYIKPDGRKKSPLPAGWPDFTLCYRGIPLALEVKTPTGVLSADQVERNEALKRNGWRVFVIYGVANVQTIFRAIDAEKEGA